MPDLIEQLLATAAEHPEAPALTGPPRAITRPLRATLPFVAAPRGVTLRYRELAARVSAVAGGLQANGFGAGERMLFSVRPSPDAVVLALGAVAAGGTVVFVDPGVGPALFAARTELAAARWAAAEPVLYAAGRWPLRALARRRGVLLPDYARLPVRHVRAGPWLPGVPRGALALSGLVSGEPGKNPVRRSRAADAAVVVFTAGTTAAPKAVVHTRGSLGAALDVLATRCALGPGTRVHTDQFLLGLPALVGGGHWSMPPYGFAPAARPDELARGLAAPAHHRAARAPSDVRERPDGARPTGGATHTFLVPADLAAVLDAVEAGRVALPRSLRTVLLGAAPVLPPLLRRARAVLPGVEFLAVYGMTEILPVAVATAEEKLAHDGDGDLVGAPLPGVTARVDDAGRLVVAGANLARGYLGEPPFTEHTTGDLARIDARGRIVLAGRATDMIIRGRTNIYPGLHEPAIAALPGVAQAVLVGVPDAIGDERVVLVLVPEPGAPPGLAGRVRAALPGVVDAAALPDEVVETAELPVAGRTRKTDRAALRARLARGGGQAPCGSR